MIKFFILLTITSYSFCQDYINVTFKVDMSNETISENGIHIMGSDDTYTSFGIDITSNTTIPAWNPSSLQLIDDDLDNIYEVTISLLPNTQYLYKFINGNAFGDDELENRSLLTVDENIILEPVCFNSIELCDFFDGIELASLEFTTNLSNAIANNGFTLGNLIIVRWGYADTQLIERTDTLNAEGFGTNFSKTIEVPKINLEKGLFYQYYKIVDNIQFREVYFNFDYSGDDQNLAERRFFNFDENTLEGSSVIIDDSINSNVDSRRSPLFMNTNQINQEITVTWEVDMRPAYYQIYSGSTLNDIQGVIDVLSPNDVYQLGVWMNGPATFFANGEDWTPWGLTLANTDSKKMVDDGTNGDAVAGDRIYTIQLNYNEESTFGQEFKLGIGGGDNESGYGLNHIENINLSNPRIKTYWGSINPLFYDAWDYDLNEPTIEACGGVSGDTNNDSEVDVLDIVMIVDHLTSEALLIGDSLCQADINFDLSVDILDVVIIVSAILQN